MLRSLFVVSSVMFLSSLVPAQADGWAPPAHARRNGNNGFAMPGNWSVGRQQSLIDKTDLPAAFTPGKVLTRIAYRRTNFQSIIAATYAAKTLNMEVSVGSTATPASGLTTTWATNRAASADFAVVLPAGNISLPSDPPTGAFNEVGPDIMVFPFTTPKIFMGPNLLIEHVNNMPPSVTSTYWSDALDNRTTILNGHNAVRGGSGCGAAAAFPTTLRAALTAASDNALGGSATYNLANATASTTFLFTIGATLTMPYGVPAPFNLSVIGAPGCPFWNTLDIVLVGATTAAGTGSQVISFPNDQNIKGLEVGMQALVISPGFNAANLTTSNGIDAWIGGRYPLTSSQVLELNNLSSVSAPATGLFIGALPITHLFWL